MIKRTSKIYKINLNNFVWGCINKKVLLIAIPWSPHIHTFFHSLETDIYELKGINLEIWKMLIKNYGFQKILKNLTKKYKSSDKLIQRDLLKFIDDLKKKNIINEI